MGPWPPKIFGISSYFLLGEKRYPKQNTVACLKSKNLATSKFFGPVAKFWAGYATEK